MNVFKDEICQKTKEAAQKTAQVPLLISIMRQGVEDAANPLYIPLAGKLKAIWRETMTFFADEVSWENAVIASWEKNILDSADSQVVVLRELIAKRLAQVYVDCMRGLAPDSPELPETLKKLSDLAFEDSAERDDSVKTSLLMARYESVRGKKESAMKLTRGIVKIGLDLLSDEDPDNDWQGYQRLATALMYYGDDDNSLAAWSLRGPVEDEGKDEVTMKQTDAEMNGESIETKVNGVSTPNGDDTKDPDSGGATVDKPAKPDQDEDDESQGDLNYSCDGDCDLATKWSYASDMYHWMDCLDILFDEKCLASVKVGTLSINVCNPKHEHLHVPKWDPEEGKESGKDHVRLRGEKVPLTDWLSQLRRTWGFEQPAAIQNGITECKSSAFVPDDWVQRQGGAQSDIRVTKSVVRTSTLMYEVYARM